MLWEGGRSNEEKRKGKEVGKWMRYEKREQ